MLTIARACIGLLIDRIVETPAVRTGTGTGEFVVELAIHVGPRSKASSSILKLLT